MRACRFRSGCPRAARDRSPRCDRDARIPRRRDRDCPRHLRERPRFPRATSSETGPSNLRDMLPHHRPDRPSDPAEEVGGYDRIEIAGSTQDTGLSTPPTAACRRGLVTSWSRAVARRGRRCIGKLTAILPNTCWSSTCFCRASLHDLCDTLEDAKRAARSRAAQITDPLTTTSISFGPVRLNADFIALFNSFGSVTLIASNPSDLAIPAKSTGGSAKSIPT
ncbi:hypothetical protein V1289_003316 [Bradyrhizobium sp. AZCC 2289]